MWKLKHVLRKPEGDSGAGGGGGAAPAPAPAAPAPSPAAPAPAPAATSAPAPSPSAAPSPAPSASPAAPAASPAPSAAPAEAKGIWPENWRETVSKDDAKKLAQLQRYGSPEAALQALFAAQERIRSGELMPKLGKDPSPEQLKEWREAHGIPETWEKYEFGKDFKVEPENEPFLDLLKKSGHDTNQSPQQIRATFEVFKGLRDKVLADGVERDTNFKRECDDALREEWGPEFRRNENLITGLLDFSGSQELKDNFLNARMPDGRRLADSPEAKRLLLGLALIQNPVGVVVPGGGASREDGIDEEIAKIEKRMREDRAGYDKDNKQQARLRDLYDAREKFKGRK